MSLVTQKFQVNNTFSFLPYQLSFFLRFFTLRVHQVPFLFFLFSFMVLELQCPIYSKVQLLLSSTQCFYTTVWTEATTLSTISRKAHLHLSFVLIVLWYQSFSIEDLYCVTLFFLFQSFFPFPSSFSICLQFLLF